MSDPTHFLDSFELAEQDILRAGERHERLNDQATRYPVPPWVKAAMLDRDGRGCRFCRTRALKLEIDHIKPRSSFPKWDLWKADRSSNLHHLCETCNRSKSNRRLVSEPRLGITATCVQCAPPAEWADTGERHPVWCARCGASHVMDENQIR